MNADVGKDAAPDNYLFLASAIAGRRVSVQVAAGSQNPASSDGHIIVLPAAAHDSNPLAWRAVVAQASLIGAGSLAPQIVRQLIGRSEAARRYGYLEVLRAAHVLADRLPSAFLSLPELREAPALTSSASASLAFALSARPLPSAPDYFGRVRPLAVLRKAVSEDGLAALTRNQAGGQLKMDPREEFDDDEETEDSKLLKLLQSPFGGKNPLNEMLSKILGAGTSKGHREKNPDQGGVAEIPVGRIERVLRRGVHAVLAKLPIDLPALDERAATQAFAYPEWNVHANQYRPGWAMVEEVEAWRPDGPREMQIVLTPPSPQLKRQLGSLGLDHEMHRRQPDGAEFDLARLLDCAIDLAAGHAPAALDVYRSSRRTRRDLAVALALDISGSTGEKNAQGASVFDQQLQVGYQIGRTLDQLGDTVALYGFHSWGRMLVRAVQLKRADERWSARVAERFAQLEPVGYTRTGAAIRHGAHLLTRQMRLPNRLLVLITDGIAYDQDYESTYAESDARKALQEARSAGTAVVCLCIGGAQDADKLRAVFGAANLLMVDDPQQVTPNIRRVCRQALLSVSSRRLKQTRSRAEQSAG